MHAQGLLPSLTAAIARDHLKLLGSAHDPPTALAEARWIGLDS
jgi:hypothetical protein